LLVVFLFLTGFDLFFQRILMENLRTRLLVLVLTGVYGCAGVTPAETLPNEETLIEDTPVATEVEESMDEETVEPSSFYTVAQAERGEDSFRETCLSCHSSSEFRGRSFQRDWRGSSMGYLYEEIVYYMPEDNPGGLATDTYLDIMAYILDLNGFPAGDSELVSDIDAMKEIVLFPRD
tara:strand:- start:58801 stop:59334 length:534 start_codon:yes stop_codon:yes gene_type:complete